MAWVVRTRGEPHSLSLAIQEEVGRASGGLPVGNIRSMDEILAESTAGRELNMVLLCIFAGSALNSAATGIYGLIAYSVQQRTKRNWYPHGIWSGEKGDVLRLIVGQGMIKIALGVGLGIGLALLLAHLMSTWLFGVRPTDPATLAIAALILSVVAFVLTLHPGPPRGQSRSDGGAEV